MKKGLFFGGTPKKTRETRGATVRSQHDGISLPQFWYIGTETVTVLVDELPAVSVLVTVIVYTRPIAEIRFKITERLEAHVGFGSPANDRKSPRVHMAVDRLFGLLARNYLIPLAVAALVAACFSTINQRC